MNIVFYGEDDDDDDGFSRGHPFKAARDRTELNVVQFQKS